ncbi:MAG: hypothetical protein NUW06_07590 [Candidatus Acetothermia bacterium]|jgi:hypothetical protein|nr:hypothetical protein [Candidatus Acetothermia bacterium]MDH7505871.1 hypothetical protein [Candidatus Acetothermia bacterium]
MFNFGRRSESIRLGLLLPLAVATGVMTSAVSRVASLLVCPQGCPFSSIQAAVDAANPGDVIQIAPGEYAESLAIAKDLTLQGARDGFVSDLKGLYLSEAFEEADILRAQEETVIRGPGAIPGPVIQVREGYHVVIDGLSITKGYESIKQVEIEDHGIAVQSGAQVVVKK